MSKKVIIHIILLFLSTTCTFLWSEYIPTAAYSLQLTAILLIFLIISHRLLTKPMFRLIESLISTTAVLLINASTGGISSPLFFLNFFLLFELSLLLEPLIPLFLSFLLIGFYLLMHDTSSSSFLLIELFAFPLITPLAIGMGNMYRKIQNQKKEIKALSNKVETLEEEIIEEEVASG